jgi:hypothetical protein
VLLGGVACLYETLESGERQIYAFYYPGDFCDLQRYAKMQAVTETAVRALTDCSIGIIEYGDLDRAIESQAGTRALASHHVGSEHPAPAAGYCKSTAGT